MKQVLLFSLLSFGILPASKQSNSVAGTATASDLVYFSVKDHETLNLFSQPSPENEKMLAVVFKAQDMCRAELKDFEFDIHYSVVSATVHFSGPGFRNVETGFINSNSLQPVRKLMDRCMPGSMVVFDNVKVVGPDKLVRTIPGTSYLLH